MNKRPYRATDHKTSSARDLRRQEKIRQIVTAATEIFLEDGFAAASMDKIVEKARVSKRTLYNYYASKDEIYIDVIQTQLGAMWKNFDPADIKPTDLTDHMMRIGTEMLRIANAPVTLSLFRNIAAESQRFPKLAYQFYEEIFEKLIDAIAMVLERESGHSGLHITDAKQASEYFLDLLTGTAYHRVVFGTTPPMNDKAIKSRTERALGYFFRTYSVPEKAARPPKRRSRSG